MKRTCLLTGASGKLGQAFCRSAGHLYDIVAVHHRNPVMVPSQDSRYADPFRPEPFPENEHPVWTIRADLTREEDRLRIVEVALARLGNVDLLINAAVHSVWAPLVSSTYALDSLSQQFAVNTFAPIQIAVLLAHSAWQKDQHENRSRNRNILNISSISGADGLVRRGQSVYAASKVALNVFTAHLASELATMAIRANALLPDSFEQKVPLASVVEAMVAIDKGADTGKCFDLRADP